MHEYRNVWRYTRKRHCQEERPIQSQPSAVAYYFDIIIFMQITMETTSYHSDSDASSNQTIHHNFRLVQTKTRDPTTSAMNHQTYHI